MKTQIPAVKPRMTSPRIDEIIRSRRRTLGLQVTPDARVVIRAPVRAPLEAINRFITKITPWIVKKQNEARARVQPVKRYIEGESFLFLGEWRRLNVDLAASTALTLTEAGFLLSARDLPNAHQIFTRWYKDETAALIDRRTSVWAEKTDLSFKKFRITHANTRWGSCSRRGTLSFSWKLVMAPEWVVDYVVIHELTHLEHLNHSQLFWNKVKSRFPRTQEAKNWLRQHQHEMNLGS